MKEKKINLEAVSYKWSDLAMKSKWALAWFATVSVACLALWSLRGNQNPVEASVMKIAEQAVELSLGSKISSQNLDAYMTSKALEKMLADRGQSGLELALANSGKEIKTRAWTKKTSQSESKWVVMGFVESSLVDAKGAGEVNWQGAWLAVLENSLLGWRVGGLSVQSLPAGSVLDEKLFDALEPKQLAGGLKVIAKMHIPASK